MEAVGLLGMLGVCSYEDIKKKSIKVITPVLFGILGVVLHLIFGKVGAIDMLLGMTVGGALYIISILSRERIGKGDALLIGISGIYLGFWNNIALLWSASILAGMSGLILIIAGKRHAQIPFVPYVLAAYIILLIIKGVGIVS